jgi:Ca-activated chloride channel family protein
VASWRRIGAALVPYALLAVVGGLVALWLWQDIDDIRGIEAVALDDPWGLALVGGAALAWWAGIHLRRRRGATFLFSRVPDLAATRPGWVARLSSLPTVLRTCALACLAVALARPQTYRSEDIEIEGIDIMIVLDLSRSMEERDLQRNRLDAGQRTIRQFLARRESDRIGLVVFGEQAMLQCPLTSEYASLDQIVSDLAIGDVPDMGTAIGDGLGLALASLRRSEAASKVVILVSDGDSNVDTEMDPHVAKQTAIDMGVRVFTVLMGEEEGGRRRLSRYGVNPALLEEIAADTGGIYFNAGDDAELEASFQTVRATLEKTRHRVTGKIYGELFPRFAYAALALLALELLLTFTRWRRFP